MTPKEKAEELIKRFYSVGAIECKQCALIAVDEILNNYYKNHFQTGKKIDYWQDVKKEIDLL
jgi:hypothetical protein